MTSLSANPDMIACVLWLSALDSAQVERTQGHRAHGLFLELMRRADPALAAALHEQAPVKPFTVAPLQGRFRKLHPGSGYTLRITLLRSSLFPPFARTVLQGKEMLLGEARFALKEALVTPGSHPWAGIATWAGLLEGARPVEELTLHFVTPTAFSLGVGDSGRKRVGLFPEPAAVFGSLLRRWNELSSTPLPADLLERVEMLPCRYDLHTESLQFSKSLQLGFIGRCSYELHGAESDRRLIHALARSAFFLGVGYKTTQGMGLARIEES
ncbi:MAG: CRISPR-associated endoribonuclease Cas6 [Herpetosiphonaceae bacterium]|nr:MAG: CRISPR-associated endoribonuclease Cas6 [Herpetosiphonaceae bacterium]